MRKLILIGLMAATVMPSAAMAQSRGELRRDRQEIREEQRDVTRAVRRGEPAREVRDQRRDVRDARQEYREDRQDRNRNWGRNDWRGYRDQNRSLYSRGNFRAPWRYQTFRPGVRIGAGYYGQRYWIADPWRYRLPNPGRYQRWVRHYDDVLLIDTRRGYVVDVIRNFYR
ncbi:RcnB family protein [Sphingobium boeckii]|uniref:Ni/Co efflux regulator RcnB n=1 Tax=Sphingobium boeckii TaxID=1082345 RepID=A0A7W9AKU7_9SPHN|nr:RcnB family protein [Sphingobium boeckii]MBB5687535.1 Ni/Co efflux regulator RcnB [Sphingobium boeckii]